MSTVNIRSTTNITAAIDYIDHGKDGKDEERAVYTTNSCEPFGVIEAAKDTMRTKNRKVEAFTIVQSFSKAEIDKDNPADVLKAHQAGVELCHRLAKKHHVMFTCKTHIDSKGGCVHNHIVIPNVDLQTQKALQGDIKLWQYLTQINDNVMRDMALEVCNQPSNGYDFMADMKNKLDLAIMCSDSFDSFTDEAAKLGIAVNDKKKNGYDRKNITFVFTDNFGTVHRVRDTKLPDYSKQSINAAINQQQKQQAKPMVELDESLLPRQKGEAYADYQL